MATVYTDKPWPDKQSWMPNVPIQSNTSATILYFASSKKEILDVKKVKKRHEQETFDQDKLGDLWVCDTDSAVNQSPDIFAEYKDADSVFSNIAIELVTGSGPTLTTTSGNVTTRQTPQPDGSTLVQTTIQDDACVCPRTVKLSTSHPALISFQNSQEFISNPFREVNVGETLQGASQPTSTEKGLTLRDPSTKKSRRPKTTGTGQQAWQLNSLQYQLKIDPKYTSLIAAKTGYTFQYPGAKIEIAHDTMQFGYTGVSNKNFKSGAAPYTILPDPIARAFTTGISGELTTFDGDLGKITQTLGYDNVLKDQYAGISIVDDDSSTTESKNLIVNLIIPSLQLLRLGPDGDVLDTFVIAENLTITLNIPLDIGQEECCEDDQIVEETVTDQCKCPREVKVEVSHPDLMKIEGLEEFKREPFLFRNLPPSNVGYSASDAFMTEKGISIIDENGNTRRPQKSVIRDLGDDIASRTWQLGTLAFTIDGTDSGDRSTNNYIKTSKGVITVNENNLKFAGFENFRGPIILSNSKNILVGEFTGVDQISGDNVPVRYSKYRYTIAEKIYTAGITGSVLTHRGLGLYDTGETPTDRTCTLFFEFGDISSVDYLGGISNVKNEKLIVENAWLKITIPLDIGQPDCCSTSNSSGSNTSRMTSTRGTARANIMSCAGSVEYVDGVIMSTRDFDNSEDLVNEVGSDLADPTADEYEGNIAGGNNTTGVTGYQDPKPVQTTPPPTNTVPANESNTTPAPEQKPISVDCSTWDGSNYDVKVGKHFILRNFTIGYPDKSKNAILGCYFPNKLTDVGSITAQTRFCNLLALATNVLDPLWEKFGQFRINSAIRNQNTVSKGVSQHVTGEAADIQFPGWTYDQYWKNAEWIKDNLPYDQFIFEHSDKTKLAWYHLSFRRSGNRASSDRTKVMTMYANKYDPGLKKYFG